MHGHALAHARGFRHGRRQLGFGVLKWSGEAIAGQRIAAGLVDLDEIGALLKLPPDHLDQLQRIVGARGVGRHVRGRVEAVGVLVAPQDIHGVSADPQARAGIQAAVDGIAYSRVGRTGALGAHVALGGKAGHQVVARRHERQNGALRNGFFHCLHILGAGMQEEMHVGIDQAG